MKLAAKVVICMQRQSAGARYSSEWSGVEAGVKVPLLWTDSVPGPAGVLHVSDYHVGPVCHYGQVYHRQSCFQPQVHRWIKELGKWFVQLLLLTTPTVSVGVCRLFASICLFVCLSVCLFAA